MEIRTAQRDVQRTFLGGFPGQLVSGGVWLLSAAAATWLSPKAAILVLVLAGTVIFPLTQMLLRLMGRPASLPKGHPMNALAMQVAFTLPLSFPLIFAATVHHLPWFYPAFMIALGAHYLPFVFLYGMPQFAALAAVLVAAGMILGMYVPALSVSAAGSPAPSSSSSLSLVAASPSPPSDDPNPHQPPFPPSPRAKIRRILTQCA
jgi:hypothetical protein